MIAVARGELERVHSFMEIPTTGYYGMRRLNAITNAVMTAFVLELREVERTDPVIRARGGVAFVQNFIVPEIVVSVVMEDMGMDSFQALRIMKATHWRRIQRILV